MKMDTPFYCQELWRHFYFENLLLCTDDCRARGVRRIHLANLANLALELLKIINTPITQRQAVFVETDVSLKSG